MENIKQKIFTLLTFLKLTSLSNMDKNISPNDINKKSVQFQEILHERLLTFLKLTSLN